MKEISNNIIWAFTGMAVIAIVLLVINPIISKSGANKILHYNGEFTRTTIYDQDTLVYTYWNQLTKRELKALQAVSDDYIIIVKEHKNDTLK